MDHEQPTRLVIGVFPDEAAAERGIDAIRQAGFSDEQIGVAIPKEGDYRMPEGALGEETTGEVTKGVLTGAAAGAPIGTIAGVALMAIAGPVAGLVGLGGLLVGAATGFAGGAMVGGYGGMIAKIKTDPGKGTWIEVPLEAGEVLVAVDAAGQDHRVRDLLVAHGARAFVDAPEE